MTSDVIEEASVRATSGFSSRLDEILAFAGYRAYGRQKVVSQFSGLSAAGVKKLYSEDRPPRPKALELLTESLIRVIKETTGHEVTTQLISEFLVLGKGALPSGKKNIADDNRDSGRYDLSRFLNDDPVYTSQIIIRIDELAKECGISSLQDIKDDKMKLIHFRVVSYCHKNRSDVNSLKVKNLIVQLLELTKNKTV